MSTKNHMRPVIIILMSVIVLVSFVPVSAFAQSSTGTAILNPSCGIEVGELIHFGTLNLDTTPPEITTIIKTIGTVTSTISVSADDWREDKTRSTGVFTVNYNSAQSSLDNTVIFINGMQFNAQEFKESQEGTQTFGFAYRHLFSVFVVVPDDDEQTAKNFASLINNYNHDNHFFNEHTIPEQMILAEAVGNTVIVSASIPGLSGNGVDMSSESLSVVPDNEFMYGGGLPNGLEHMLSSVTKYTITTDGTSSTGTLYSDKIAFASKNVPHILTTQATPTYDISLSLQLSGEDTLFNLPYGGPIFQKLTFTSECNVQ